MHKDDDGEDCDYSERECAYGAGHDPICPDCGASDDEMSLVHGDHGFRCGKCNATFTCP